VIADPITGEILDHPTPAADRELTRQAGVRAAMHEVKAELAELPDPKDAWFGRKRPDRPGFHTHVTDGHWYWHRHEAAEPLHEHEPDDEPLPEPNVGFVAEPMEASE
jgi:hypothetical protein